MNQSTVVQVIPLDDEPDLSIEAMSDSEKQINAIRDAQIALSASLSTFIEREAHTVIVRVMDSRRRMKMMGVRSMRRTLRKAKQFCRDRRSSQEDSSVVLQESESSSSVKTFSKFDSRLDITEKLVEDCRLKYLQERKSIWNQAIRVKRMKSLLRLIEDTQSQLLNELQQNRHDVVEETMR